MYRRYTLDEVKHKIVGLLQGDRAGLSGIEIAEKTGINRMTITKYLNILLTLGLVSKKKAGPVNIWYLESGIIDLEFPFNSLEVQQNFITAIFENDYDKSQRIILSALNSTLDKIRILIDIVLPTFNTMNELYNRGRIGDTERISHLTILLEIVDLIKFSSQLETTRHNAHVLSVASSEDKIFLAKAGALALRILGWNSSYLGNVERHIDPFFDMDFQRFLGKIWNEKKGLIVVCIFSSQESSLRFLSIAANTLKKKLKGELFVVLLTSHELTDKSEHIGADVAFTDLESLIDWCEKKFRSHTGQ
ncbi:MAG: HTH domain-containing protein [Nitrososphaeraceae archaeon]|nr:HTH domain-containing protein [Nitrososphaeraceae archaeon]